MPLSSQDSPLAYWRLGETLGNDGRRSRAGNNRAGTYLALALAGNQPGALVGRHQPRSVGFNGFEPVRERALRGQRSTRAQVTRGGMGVSRRVDRGPSCSVVTSRDSGRRQRLHPRRLPTTSGSSGSETGDWGIVKRAGDRLEPVDAPRRRPTTGRPLRLYVNGALVGLPRLPATSRTRQRPLRVARRR